MLENISSLGSTTGKLYSNVLGRRSFIRFLNICLGIESGATYISSDFNDKSSVIENQGINTGRNLNMCSIVNRVCAHATFSSLSFPSVWATLLAGMHVYWEMVRSGMGSGRAWEGVGLSKYHAGDEETWQPAADISNHWKCTTNVLYAKSWINQYQWILPSQHPHHQGSDHIWPALLDLLQCPRIWHQLPPKQSLCSIVARSW